MNLMVWCELKNSQGKSSTLSNYDVYLLVLRVDYLSVWLIVHIPGRDKGFYNLT